MRKTEEATIDGLQVTCTQLGFEAADLLWFDLLAIVTPAIGKLEGLTAGMDIAKLGPAIGALLNAMPRQKATELKRRILEGTLVLHEASDRKLPVAKKEIAEEIFSGRLPTYYKVLWFSLKTNFADFFSGDTAPFAHLMQLGGLELASTTPTNADTTTEPGNSGDEVS